MLGCLAAIALLCAQVQGCEIQSGEAAVEGRELRIRPEELVKGQGAGFNRPTVETAVLYERFVAELGRICHVTHFGKIPSDA